MAGPEWSVREEGGAQVGGRQDFSQRLGVVRASRRYATCEAVELACFGLGMISFGRSFLNKIRCQSSHLGSKYPPNLCPPRSHQRRKARSHARARKDLRIHILPPSSIDQRTRNWRARQRRKARHSKDHPNSDPGFLRVGRQACQRSGKQRLDRGRKQAVQDRKDPQSRDGVDRDPTVEANTHERRERQHGIHRPSRLVSKVVRDDAARQPNTIHRQEQIDTRALVRAQNVPSKTADEIETNIQAPEEKKHADGEQEVGQFLERSPVDDRPALARRQPRL